MPPSIVVGVLGEFILSYRSYKDCLTRLVSIFADLICIALQGAFAEHQNTINALATKSCTKIKSLSSLTSRLVRTPEELAACDALVIPGGESTTMAILARTSGLLEPLRQFVREKPVWGTCAGAILLAESIEGGKKGGQELLGGISVKIGRNGFGSQVRIPQCEPLKTSDSGF